VQNKENTHYTNIRQKIFAKHNEWSIINSKRLIDKSAI
jgi:hypothetical protein